MPKKSFLFPEDKTAMTDKLVRCRFFFTTVQELKEQVRGRKFNLIHAHSPFVLHCGRELAEQLKVPYVITLHGVLAWAKRYRTPLAAADMIIAVGTETAGSRWAGLTGLKAGLFSTASILIIFAHRPKIFCRPFTCAVARQGKR